MTIRAAEERDITDIVRLLKLSLGEGLMPKSEAYWRWKHIENPFGASPVLLAEEDGILIGVRAFMRWEWTDGKQHYQAVRAVDTATHPDYQGKGIFKKLTLGLVETCQQQGVHFVFNTPNQQSRPGYIKMQWRDAGRLPVRFKLVTPLHKWMIKSNPSFVNKPCADWLRDVELTKDQHVSLHTPIATNYLRWRYATVPVAQYFVLTNGIESVVYRLKINRWGKEFRITDCFHQGEKLSVVMQQQLSRQASLQGARVITSSGIVTGLTGGMVLQQGPQVTVRNLNYNDFESLIAFKNWSPTLGDLELF